MMNPNPTCPNKCRFSYTDVYTTAAYYPPVFDKDGNNINPDLNTTSGKVSCSTCDKLWSYSTQLGKTTFTEITNG